MPGGDQLGVAAGPVQGGEDRIDPVTGVPEDPVHTPFPQPRDQGVADQRHGLSSADSISASQVPRRPPRPCAGPEPGQGGGVRANQVLLDLFGRLPALVRSAVRDLTPEQLTSAPGEGANTIAWLVWHLARIEDDHVADARGAEQVWTSGRVGLALRPAGRDAGHRLRPRTRTGRRGAARRAGGRSWSYYDAVHARTVAYLEQLGDDDLDRVVDEGWDPPVTLGVRLVSVANDDAQHVGQAAYLRGLLSG